MIFVSLFLYLPSLSASLLLCTEKYFVLMLFCRYKLPLFVRFSLFSDADATILLLLLLLLMSRLLFFLLCFCVQIACRYDKGEWSKCVSGSMSRKDNVRTGSDASCKATREITKNCNKDKKQKNKEKSECRHISTTPYIYC